uniref:Uncharacterized protein n=1 Tax=Lepeophtheirus salmonis TaxID=72036 RepID=A0A0K2TF58_LEPSM
MYQHKQNPPFNFSTMCNVVTPNTSKSVTSFLMKVKLCSLNTKLNFYGIIILLLFSHHLVLVLIKVG